jgi:uncharacterized protein (DUF2336 family)
MVEQTKVPNLDGLTELANRDGVDIKPTLLRVVTDLYVQKPVHSEEEETHYTELALRLVDQVDAVTRTIVAARLGSYPAAPQAVVERLARGRVQRGEVQTETTPVAVQSPLLSVNPAPAATATQPDLSELFLSADAHERRMILLNLEYATLQPAAPIAPPIAHEAIRRLEMAALSHNSESFAQEVERTLSIPRNLARRLIDDQSGEPVLVLAMALGMPPDVLQRILLCLNPAISHSVLRVYELSTLYEEMVLQSALRLLAIWQAAHSPAQRLATQRPAHQPQYYDDGKQQPALPARPAIRWDEHERRREG